MSGVFKAVKKVFKKLKESKIVKAVVIAAAIWFTAGVATAYMAAPAAGLGGAMSASATSMWATATTGAYVSAAEVATANVAMAASGTQTAMLAAQTAEFGAAGATATDAALATSAATEAGVASTSTLASAEGAGIVNSAAGGEAIAGYNAPAAAGTVPGAPGGGAAASGNFFSNNPMATMVLGQAGAGAYGSYEARRAEEERIKEDEKIRRERGLMGVDYEGNYQGKPAGIVNSQSVAPQQTTEQATAAPVVQQQTVATQQTAAPVNRPVDRKNLPQLNKQGLVAPQQVT